MKQYRYPVNPAKAALCAVISLFFLALCAVYIYEHDILPALFFCLISVPFLKMVMEEGSTVYISKDSIRLCFLSFTRRSWSWNDVKEVGIAGERVILKGKNNNVGSVFIYLSPCEMDLDSRFQMCLKWPPKDKIYFYYSEERIEAVQMIWGKKIELYNIGNLDFPGRDGAEIQKEQINKAMIEQAVQKKEQSSR